MSDMDLTEEDTAAMQAMKDASAEAPEGQSDGEKERPDPVDSGESGEERQEPQDKADKPEFKSSRSEDKPPEGFVPHGAMHAERVKRQDAERRLEELERRFNESVAPKEEPPQWVDPLENPEGFKAYEDHQRKELKDRLDRFEQQQTRQQEASRTIQEVAAQEQEFLKTTPDYMQAASHLQQARANELRAMGLGDEEIRARVSQDANALVQAARAAGINPAQLVYLRAQQSGYQKAADPAGGATNDGAAEGEGEKMTRMERARQQTEGLGRGGGSQAGKLTASQLAAMPEAEYDRVVKERPDEVRAALGG